MTQSIPAKLDAIKRKIQKDGQAIQQGPEGGWEANGVKAMIADGGYSVAVVTEQLSVWGEHGSGRSGFFRGDEAALDTLMAQLGVEA